MGGLGKHWSNRDEEDDYNFNLFSRYNNDDFEEKTDTSKRKLSNEEIVKILKSRSKKDLDLILSKLNEKN